ncbi:MAG TPA: PDGLE domain-containing protein [Syntrophomonadaceae bacterium]|nr:PDGLE domain-containing protein [Syntrophomonadaceae bacterium]
MFNKYRKLCYTVLALIILSPLGLLATGTAFGEWGTDQLQDRLGFLPAGMARLQDLWQHTLLPDYGIAGFDTGFGHSALGYVLSALIGVILVVAIVTLISRIIKD